MSQWNTEQWFTSPWNFVPEVRDGMSFSDNIKIHDVTLRDGEQQAGLLFNKDQKIALAEQLAELGVHRIEAGMPAVSAMDAQAITEIAKRNLGPEIMAFARCTKEDVKSAVDCGCSGIIVEIPCSEHIIERAYRWPLERAINTSIEVTSYAHELGLKVIFFPIDASRADINWFLDTITKIASEGYMDGLALADTVGGINPHAVPYLIKEVKKRISVPVEVHFHDDFGMGAANTVFALAAGADVAHTTITGIGERAGNTPMEDLVLTMKCMYGIDLGLRYDKLVETSKLMRQITGMSVRPNRPIVGDHLYEIESGIITSWYQNCIEEYPTEFVPFHWDLVGQKPPKILMGKKSGAPNVEVWIKRLGMQEPSKDKMMPIIMAVKDASIAKGGPLTDDEFRGIVEKLQ